jgi:EAL and modified HD-GYP domain-containing signal transduction protein
MEDIFVARQPIYNHALEIAGYELLFRDAHSNTANFTDGAQASSRLIINTYMGIGLENIVGSNPAFINLTSDFFLDHQPIPMTREQVVLEVPTDILSDERVSSGVHQLYRDGYAISLDDFIYSEKHIPMLQAAEFVKIDISLFTPEELAQQYELCAQHGVKVLAKKVEKHEEFQLCREIGFDCYQGYFFCQPDIVKGRNNSCNRGILLNILDRLQDPESTMEQIANIVTQDVELSYKLLRYINCANYALRREIDSVQEALVMIGIDMVRKWAVLILMSDYNEDKPQELSTVAMVRAHMCELLGSKIHGINPHQAFTVGLFSTLDAVMDTPMIELLDTISLSSPIKFALLDYEGELGELLKQVMHYERGEWSEINTEKLSRADYSQSYLASVQWANDNRVLLN